MPTEEIIWIRGDGNLLLQLWRIRLCVVSDFKILFTRLFTSYFHYGWNHYQETRNSIKLEDVRTWASIYLALWPGDYIPRSNSASMYCSSRIGIYSPISLPIRLADISVMSDGDETSWHNSHATELTCLYESPYIAFDFQDVSRLLQVIVFSISADQFR